MRQYLACEFTPGGRTYTYHFDGDQPLTKGERVIVEGKNGEATITVVSIADEAPPFETKAIKGRAPAEVEAVP